MLDERRPSTHPGPCVLALLLTLAGCASAPPHARAVEEVRRGYQWLANGDRERAEVAFEHALEIAPDLGEARTGLGLALRVAGRPDLALVQFDAAIAADPDLAEAHAARAESLLALGEDRRAEEAFRDALRIDPDQVAARITRARWLARRAEKLSGGERRLLLDRARRDLLHAAEARPEMALVHHDLGWVSWLRDEPSASAASYLKAAAIDPAMPEAWAGACAALTASGREAEARATCARAARTKGAPAGAGAP